MNNLRAARLDALPRLEVVQHSVPTSTRLSSKRDAWPTHADRCRRTSVRARALTLYADGPTALDWGPTPIYRA